MGAVRGDRVGLVGSGWLASLCLTPLCLQKLAWNCSSNAAMAACGCTWRKRTWRVQGGGGGGCGGGVM